MLDFGPTSHSFFSQRLQLRYVDWGNQDAPLLLLIHGGRDHSRSWDWVARELRQDWHIIAPDLRGHGDSAWSPDGHYDMLACVYDLSQLIHQLGNRPVTIVAHSLGGAISLRYTGIYPENVKKLVAIEGIGLSIDKSRAQQMTSTYQSWRNWIESRRAAAGRQHRRYDTIANALARMQEENSFLSDIQARHLTRHGVIQNEDGTYSWKFDNYLRQWPPNDMSLADMQMVWSQIHCPLMLCYGEDGWMDQSVRDAQMEHFTQTQPIIKSYKKAGHWLHHDQFESFMQDLRSFIYDTTT